MEEIITNTDPRIENILTVPALLKLTQKIPQEFLERYEEDGKEFIGYKAQYAINLLNDTFGLGTWSREIKTLMCEKLGGSWVVAKRIYLNIPGYDSIIGEGACYAKKLDTALKSASTSAFKNACRYLGIGNELYLQGFVEQEIVIEEVKEEVSIPNELQNMIDKINSCKRSDQLESLKEKIENISGTSSKNVVLKAFNNKKISLLK